MEFNKQKDKELYKVLEAQGKFDEFTGIVDASSVIQVDKDYEYIKKSFKERFRRAFCNLFTRVVAPFVNFIYFGLKIKDRKYVKQLKKQSYISISNHVSPLDIAMLRHILGYNRNLYCTGAMRNSRKNIIGWFLRGVGMLPFSENFTAQKNMNKAITELMKSNATVHLYPERAMWVDYNKPRPFKKGAFTYAVKENVPILPVFYCPKPTKGWRRIFGIDNVIDAYVLPPIYPDNNIAKPERANVMREQMMTEYFKKYRQVYKDNNPVIYNIEESIIPTLPTEVQRAIELCRQTAATNQIENNQNV